MSGRATKSGLALQVEMKMEQRYDQEEALGTPKAAFVWLNAVLAGQHEECKASDWKTMNEYLKNGVALGKFINVLLKSDGAAPVQVQKKVLSPFVAMTNIENFNLGCQAYGLRKESCFQSTDLSDSRKGPFLNVINCINNLGFVANNKNFEPAYTGKQEKYLDNE